MPNQLVVKTAALPVKPTSLLVVYVHEDLKLAGEAATLFAQTGHDLKKLAATTSFTGKKR